MSRHKRSVVKKTVITVVAIAAAVTAVGFYIEKRSYHTYKVVQTSEQEDIVSTNYVEMDGNILRYSPDGVSLVSDKMSTLWSETYQMQNPVADVNGTRAVIADKDGTTLEIYDKSRVKNRQCNYFLQYCQSKSIQKRSCCGNPGWRR